MTLDMIVVTATAPVNIAVIKYWGKRDEKLILPANGSISVTLDNQLCAKTTIAASSLFESDRIWLNGKEESINGERLQNVLKEIRRRARKRKQNSEDESCDMFNWKVHICSENNFPTAAGLASSAAGYACLVYTLAKVFSIEGEVSHIASDQVHVTFLQDGIKHVPGKAVILEDTIYGGFVEWVMGEKADGSDSIAQQVEPAEHWPDMEVLILVVSGGKKHTLSTQGMMTTLNTSEFMKHRVKNLVPKSLSDMRTAIKNKDFQSFAEITMRDSNQMHAACLDAYPPVVYLTDVSHDIIRLIHAINSYYGTSKVCYTFDAGPNACLYLMKEDVPLVLGLVQHFFPPTERSASEFITGLKVNISPPSQDLVNAIPLKSNSGAVQYVIHTQVGSGPRVIDSQKESLLNDKGLPINIIAS